MAQIAQQDHLYFPVADDSELSADEKAGLWQKVKNGTILDTVLVCGNSQMKIIAYVQAPDSAPEIFYYSISDGNIQDVVLG